MMTTVQSAPENSVSMKVSREQAYASAVSFSGDPFAMIIAQMAAQMGEDASADAAVQQPENRKPDGKAQEELAAQIGAAGSLQTIQPAVVQEATAQAENTQDAPAETPLVMVQNLAAAGNIVQVPQETLAALTQRSIAHGSGDSDEASTAAPAQAPVSIELSAEATAAGVEKQSQSDAQDFDSLLQQQETQSKEKPADVKIGMEQSAAAVETETAPCTAALSETQMVKAEAMAREPQLLQQLEKSVNETLASGKQELTMKLKPEALGEITVRLVEQDGKMALHITAANMQTAKLINDDIDALREAVRPMNVEVHEAVQQNTATEQGTTQYNQFSQQFSSQQQFASQQAWQHAASANGSYSYGRAEEEQSTAASAIRQNAPQTALDTYV